MTESIIRCQMTDCCRQVSGSCEPVRGRCCPENAGGPGRIAGNDSVLDRQDSEDYNNRCGLDKTEVTVVPPKMAAEWSNLMFEKIKEIISEHFDIDAGSVTPELSLRDDLGADSLDMLEMVMVLEDEYNLEIDIENDMESIRTIGDVVEYLKSRGVE